MNIAKHAAATHDDQRLQRILFHSNLNLHLREFWIALCNFKMRLARDMWIPWASPWVEFKHRILMSVCVWGQAKRKQTERTHCSNSRVETFREFRFVHNSRNVCALLIKLELFSLRNIEYKLVIDEPPEETLFVFLHHFLKKYFLGIFTINFFLFIQIQLKS